MCRWTNNDWFPDNVCGQGGSAFVWTWSSIANKFISGLYKCNSSCEVFTKENLVFRPCCRSRLGNRGSRILLLLSWKHWTFDKCQALVYTNTLIFWPYVPRPWRQIHGRRTQGGPASLNLSRSGVKLQACEDESWDFMSLEYGDSVEILTSMITLIWEERKQTITANLTLKKEFKSFCVLVTDKGESSIRVTCMNMSCLVA